MAAPTDELCGSFFDLWHHLDPFEAARYDPVAPKPALFPYDRDAVRRHVAALRSLEGALEQLAVDSLEDEIDRTALLDTVRSVTFRFAHERPHVKNPAFWLLRLCDVLTRRPGDPTVLDAVPTFLDVGQRTLDLVPAFLLDLAVALADEAALLIKSDAVPADPPAGGPAPGPPQPNGAAGAIERFRLYLRHDVKPQADPLACGVGEAGVDRLLHYGHAIAAGGGESLRVVSRMVHELEARLLDESRGIDQSRDWRELVASGRDDRPSGLEWFRTAGERVRSFAGTWYPTSEPTPPAEWMPSYLELVEPRALLRWPALALDQEPRVQLSRAHGSRLATALAIQFGVPGQATLLLGRRATGSTVRRRLASSSAAGGWGLAAIETLLELGIVADPLDRLRVRAFLYQESLLGVIDLAIHLRRMGPADAVNRVHEALGFDPGAARTVRRLCMRPLEQAASLIGWEAWRVLRRDWLAARGAGVGPLDFHRAALAYGALPVPLVRWGMGVDG